MNARFVVFLVEVLLFTSRYETSTLFSLDNEQRWDLELYKDQF